MDRKSIVQCIEIVSLSNTRAILRNRVNPDKCSRFNPQSAYKITDWPRDCFARSVRDLSFFSGRFCCCCYRVCAQRLTKSHKKMFALKGQTNFVFDYFQKNQQEDTHRTLFASALTANTNTPKIHFPHKQTAKKKIYTRLVRRVGLSSLKSLCRVKTYCSRDRLLGDRSSYYAKDRVKRQIAFTFVNSNGHSKCTTFQRCPNKEAVCGSRTDHIKVVIRTHAE